MDSLLREETVAAVDALVGELLDRADCQDPPIDAISLAREQLGMVVCLDRRQPQRGRAQRNGGARHIFLRPEPTPERQQWTVAHEIGEHLRPALLERVVADGEQEAGMRGESLANLFAYRLLVPGRWFLHDAPDFDYDVARLKQRYQTASHEVVAWRLLDLPQPSVITVVDNDRVTRRRSNAWQVTRRLHALEKECQQRVHFSSQPEIMTGCECSVHGWPVHQPDWKREILRTVFED